ncbi:MAG: bifunctional diaminohydroxyphosphoribosylaminopyrimidine deaminase/5-amino-6-(5-phosphoribosylamino)uracil reductase RibD [Rikenellaceae bacterium]
MEQDEIYMARALRLAKLAKGKTATNPMVGCVIVENGEVIGEGYHRVCGQAHAEVNAINSVKDKNRLKNSTLYVNLEPCSHYGKTPPCANLIIEHSIARVVIGCKDSFSKVNGRGIAMMQESGIEVKVGVLESESIELNRRFFTFHKEQRPYIILKWAQTCDGFIDNNRDSNTPPTWLTGARCKEIVHKMRSQESAIMVGSNTVTRDNPSLTVREWSGKNPIRVVIDRQLKLSREHSIFNSEARTIIINSIKEDENHIKIDFNTDDAIKQMLYKLYEKGVCSMIVEGGEKLLNLFIYNNLYDEAKIFISPLSLNELDGGDGKNGVKAPLIPGGKKSSSKTVEGVIIKNILKR